MKNSLEIVIKQVHLEGGFKRGGRIRVAKCLKQIVPNRWTSEKNTYFYQMFLCLLVVHWFSVGRFQRCQLQRGHRRVSDGGAMWHRQLLQHPRQLQLRVPPWLRWSSLSGQWLSLCCALTHISSLSGQCLSLYCALTHTSCLVSASVSVAHSHTLPLCLVSVCLCCALTHTSSVFSVSLSL